MDKKVTQKKDTKFDLEEMQKKAARFQVISKRAVTAYNINTGRSEFLKPNAEYNSKDYQITTLVNLSTDGVMKYVPKKSKFVVVYKPSIVFLESHPMIDQAVRDVKIRALEISMREDLISKVDDIPTEIN